MHTVAYLKNGGVTIGATLILISVAWLWYSFKDMYFNLEKLFEREWHLVFNILQTHPLIPNN